MTIQQKLLRARLVGLLLLLTVLAIVFQAGTLNKVLTIDHNSPFPYGAVDDSTIGGKTKATLQLIDGNLVLDCEIVASDYQWPYCAISFDLSNKTDSGIDLSEYHHVKLWVKYDTPQDVGIRFQTHHFDPSYSVHGDEDSLKYNVIEFYEKKSTYPVDLSINDFQVPTWWLSAREIPLTKVGPEFTDTRLVDVATGSGIKPGKYRLIIEKIEFSGKYIDDQNLYLILLGIWGCLALVYFITAQREVRAELKSSEHRQQELEALNKLLDVKSQRLQEKIVRDPLTGVLNRDGIAYLFESDPKKNSEINHLSMIFIDIDHFKKVNDTYGHSVGDQVLIQFATVLSQNTREIDVIARWGGEEFVLACPNTELANAEQLAEKLRTCIASHDWPKDVIITASFGVAQMHNESPAEFIERADKALYAAKAQGRNIVVVSNHA